MDREKQELRLAENQLQSMVQSAEEAATVARVENWTEVERRGSELGRRVCRERRTKSVCV